MRIAACYQRCLNERGFFPRLAKSTVMQSTIGAGAVSRDFFGLASDKQEGAYRGFILGKATTPFMDALLLIEPSHAAAYEEATRPAAPIAPPPTDRPLGDGPTPPGPGPNVDPPPPTRAAPTRFYATAELDAVTASLKFSTIVSELVELFSATHGTKVRIRVDIEAEDSRGFDEGVVRAAKENSKVLGMKSSEFE